jgi:two-component system phosphate regulon response regulator PhoB
MVVEDDRGASRAITLLLQHKGYEPILAESVKDALVQLSQEPACVILDLMLPDGSGVDVLRFIRDHNLPIRVVVTTGTGDDQLIKAVIALRPEQFITKPVEFAKLLSAIQQP